jgi:inner membrane protein
MDTLTHGIVGAAVTHAGFSPRLGRKAILVGFAAGMLADADGLIRSSVDPFLRVEFHRHFTHALVFVPLGALIALVPFLASQRGRREWRGIYAACLLAYVVHPLLDIATSYGTLFLWPFSSARLAVDWISVVDPLFSLPLLVLVLWAAVANRRRLTSVAVGFALLYLGLGAMQEARARQFQEEIASSRGHRIQRGRVMPTLGNLLVWRSLYVTDGMIYADALRLVLPGHTSYVPGESVPLVQSPPLEPAVPADLRERYQREFGRLQWFADGYLARSPQDPTVISDMRYSVRAETFEPLWGLRFRLDRRQVPVEWVRLAFRGRQFGFVELWALVEGRSPRLKHRML